MTDQDLSGRSTVHFKADNRDVFLCECAKPGFPFWSSTDVEEVNCPLCKERYPIETHCLPIIRPEVYSELVPPKMFRTANLAKWLRKTNDRVTACDLATDKIYLCNDLPKVSCVACKSHALAAFMKRQECHRLGHVKTYTGKMLTDHPQHVWICHRCGGNGVDIQRLDGKGIKKLEMDVPYVVFGDYLESGWLPLGRFDNLPDAIASADGPTAPGNFAVVKLEYVPEPIGENPMGPRA